MEIPEILAFSKRSPFAIKILLSMVLPYIFTIEWISVKRNGDRCNMTDKKTIVTSFLRFHGKILLLQRSSKVGTYKGQWAGCSGYLEENEDPLNRAVTEIQEELGITSEQITLVKMGEPFEIIDEKIGITWNCYPFLFELKTDQIQLDWEHKNYIWILPDEIINFPTVPKLKEAYDRVKT